MKGFHQQLTVMRKGYTQPHPHQPHPHQPRPQQPQQLFRPFMQDQSQPSLQPSHNVMPQFLHHSLTTPPQPHSAFPTASMPHLQEPSNNIAGPSGLLVPPNIPHLQGHSSRPSNNITGPSGLLVPPNMPHLQGHSSRPSNNITGPSGQLVPPNIFPFQQSQTAMGGVSQISPGYPVGGNIAGSSGQSLDTPICIIDSDSDNEDSYTTTATNVDNHIPSILSNAPFNIAKTSIPVAMVTPSVATVTPVRATHIDRRLDPQPEGHAPSDSAVTSALAGFVNFQKEMCKDLSKKGDGVAGTATARLTLSTLANTIQAFKQTEPARQTPCTTSSSVEGTNVIPVSETGQTSLSEPPPVLSPLATLLSSYTNQH